MKDYIENNPQYYKGYRYEKIVTTKNGGYIDNTERWFDYNNVLRKTKLDKDVYYYNERGELHNEDGYAVEVWNYVFSLQDKKNVWVPRTQEYWLNGKRLSEQERLFLTDELKPMELLKHYPDKDTEIFYNNFIHFKTNTDSKNINTERWYDENKICRKEVIFHEHKKREVFYYNEKSELHNEDNFAYEYYNKDGITIFQQYWLNGKENTVQEWEEETGNKSTCFEIHNESHTEYLYKRYPLCETWSDENGLNNKVIYYYGNGNKQMYVEILKDKTIHDLYDVNGKFIKPDKNKPTSFEYNICDKFHYKHFHNM